MQTDKMITTCEASASLNVFEETSMATGYASCYIDNDVTIMPFGLGKNPLEAMGYAITIINQLLIFGVTAALSWKCFEMKLEKTAMHAYLCTLGFVCLLAEGILVRCRGNPFTYGLDSDTKDTAHFLLQSMGGLLGICGTLQKSVAKKKHFHTWHGKFGIAACVFFIINLVCGCLGIYSVRYRLMVSPLVHGIVHNALGLITFAIVMLAQYTGYNTGFFRRNFIDQGNTYKFLTFVIFILTALTPYKMLLAKLYQLL